MEDSGGFNATHHQPSTAQSTTVTQSTSRGTITDPIDIDSDDDSASRPTKKLRVTQSSTKTSQVMVNDLVAQSDNSVHPPVVDITNEESEDYEDEDVVDSSYFGNDIEAELGLENDTLSYNNASGMIYSLHHL